MVDVSYRHIERTEGRRDRMSEKRQGQQEEIDSRPTCMYVNVPQWRSQ